MTEKLPRKEKKQYLGIKLSGNKLRKLLSVIKVTPAKGPEPTIVYPYPFCPKCGCTQVRYYSHPGVWYPERWVSGYCERCNNHVVESDNSPYYHVLECEDYKF